MVKKLFIDVGHGGNDPGARGIVTEKEINLILGLKLRDYLNDNYYCNIKLSRTDDSSVSLRRRCDMANEWGADYFISLHSNAFNGDAQGYEDFIWNGGVGQQTKDYQNSLHPDIAEVWTDAGRNNRGKKQANFFVLRNTRMSALLIENGFVDNETDADLLQDGGFQNKLVKAMGDSLAEHLGWEEKEQEKSEPNELPEVIRTIDVYVNDEKVDYTGYLINNTTHIPAKFIAEFAGGEVEGRGSNVNFKK